MKKQKWKFIVKQITKDDDDASADKKDKETG